LIKGRKKECSGKREELIKEIKKKERAAQAAGIPAACAATRHNQQSAKFQYHFTAFILIITVIILPVIP